jgi:pSer/pThr/pTyr-binding forkhead associated (FHA) protein
MVQLNILSGKQAGQIHLARRFPVRIGRAAGSDLCSAEDGVWEQHLEINLKAGRGFQLRSQGEALVRINGQVAREEPLKNGDLIEAGSLKLRFWLSEPRQSSYRLRETLIWLALVAITLGQVALIYRFID